MNMFLNMYPIFLFTILLLAWSGNCEVAFVNPPPFAETTTPSDLSYQLGYIVNIQWTSTEDVPLGLRLWHSSTPGKIPVVIFGGSI